MDEGERFPHRDSSQRDVQQAQEYQIWANEYHSEFIFPADGFTTSLSMETFRQFLRPVLGTICPVAFGTQIRVMGEKGQGYLETVNCMLGSADWTGRATKT